MAWSPDGRWLAYLSGQLGNETWKFLAYDSHSGKTVELGQGRPVQGDHRLLPEWSASSRYVSIAFSEQDLSRSTRRVYQPTNPGRFVSVPFEAVWATRDDVLFGYVPDSQPLQLGSLDISTGRWRAYDIYWNLPFVPVPQPILSPDQRYAAVAGYAVGDPSNQIVALTPGESSWSADGLVQAWSQDGAHLLTSVARACRNGHLIYDAATTAAKTCLEDTTGARFSPSGKFLAYVKPQTYSIDPRALETQRNDVYVLDLTTGQHRKVLSDARGPLRCLVWSPNARWLVLTAICDGV
jgi:hypothetical protein